ncbi:hypothetical protein HDU83_001638 [Entophlyctis luteolus]|nr:hypothetical protein HDU83_001638 [Entophlyctis luteolus]KAJ3390516.1 hypothetical protein HDU84_007367 [Entophlyctis sp. JEL0112]
MPLLSSSYSQRQLFSVISDVKLYPRFVPWCVDAKVIESRTFTDTDARRTQVTRMKANLTVGFNSLNETYTSDVTCKHLSSVEAIASQSSVFKTLTTKWTLTPATTIRPPGKMKSQNNPSNRPVRYKSADILKASAITILENARSSTEDTSLKKEIDASNHPFCEVDFDIAFEFNSVLYARVTDMFFDQVCLTMVESFVTRMESVYGKANALK